MKRDYITQNDLSTVDPTKQEYFINVNQVYLGVHVMTEMANPNIQTRPDLVAEFQNRARDFIKTGCCQIKKRYDFEDLLLQKLHIFSPKNATSNSLRTSEPSLLPIMSKVLCIMTNKTTEEQQAIDDEWRLLPNTNLPENTFAQIDLMSPDEFWSKILAFTESSFKNLSRFVLEVLSLPHANADSESKPEIYN